MYISEGKSRLTLIHKVTTLARLSVKVMRDILILALRWIPLLRFLSTHVNVS